MTELDAGDDRARWSTSVVLSDGDTAFVRPITTDDAPLLLAFHERQPRENLYRRFLSPKPTLSPKELSHFTDIDFHDRVALVVEERGEWIAWASYERWKARDDAEVAFMVDADHQGRGIATILLEHLAAIARSNGILRFTAEALSDNRAMLRVFSRAGWPVEKHFDSGLTEVEFPLTDTEHFVDSVEAREHRADSRAIARLLLPRSIAVIGASDVVGSVGHQLWSNAARFDGPIYAVNPARSTIDGRPSFGSVGDIPDDIWLAVIAVPASALPAVLEECIAKRVRGAIVITAIDGTDTDMPALVANARRNGLRIIGPTSMGVFATRRGGVQAALVPGAMNAGGVAISMQSGSLGSSLLQLASQLHLGVSWFVSLGDKTDVSGNDLLQFWEDDESTAVVAMYTETFGNPRKFARIARRVGRRKPIVAVRTGTAAIGNAADALYQQAGLIEVPTVRALLDTARVLATQPVPSGPNVAILTNARSPGVLARAAVTAAGLRAVDPPVALSWRSTPDDLAEAIQCAAADDAIDAIMVIHAPPLATAYAPVAEIDEACSGLRKPIVAVMLGREDGPVQHDSRVPAFSFPEPAAAVLGRMYAYSRWLATEAESLVDAVTDVDVEKAHQILTNAVERGDTELSFADVHALLAAYGVEMPHGLHAHDASADAIVAAAEVIGYPVVIKATRRRVGRSARAGIALDISNDGAAREAIATLRESLGTDADSIVVQRMAAPGVDVRVHCESDPLLGPVITVGLGSLQSIGVDDGASRLAPTSQAAARAMISSSSVGAALQAAGLDDQALVDTIVRVSHLAVNHPEIAAVEIDPLLVSVHACAATDVHVAVHEPTAVPFPLRRLV